MTWRRFTRMLTILIALAATMTLIAVAAFYWIISTLNAEAGRERVEWIAGRMLHREVRIGGAIEIDLSLHPRIAVQNLRIANPPWAHAPFLITVERLHARIALLPLIQHRLDVSELRARDAQVWLEQGPRGRGTWHFGRWLRAESVRSATVEHARVTVRTHAGTQFSGYLSHLDASVDYVRPDDHRDTNASERPMSGARWSVDGRAAMAATSLVFRGGSTQPAVAEVYLRATGKDLGVLGTGFDKELPSTDHYDALARLRSDHGRYMGALTASVDGLRTRLPLGKTKAGVRIGTARIEASVDGAGSHLDAISQARVRLSVRDGGLHVKKDAASPPIVLTIDHGSATADAHAPVHLDLAGKLNSLPVQARATLGHLPDLLSGSAPAPVRIRVSGKGLESIFRGIVSKPIAGANVDGNLTLDMDSLSRLQGFIGGRWPVLGPVRPSAHVGYKAHALLITHLLIDAGRSRLNGQARLIDTAPRLQVGIRRGEIDLTDLDRVRVALARPHTRPDDRKDAKAILAMTLPTEALRDISASLGIGRLQFVRDGGLVGELSGSLAVEHALLSLQVSAGRRLAAHRSLKARLALDAAHTPVLLHAGLDVDDFDYGRMLQRVGVTDKVQGTLKLHADMTTRGDTVRTMLANAQGGATFVGGEGLLPRRLLELWGGGLIRALVGVFGGGDQMRLNCAAARFAMGQGMLRSDLLLIDTANITVGGDLALNLETEELNGLFRSRSKQATLLKLGRPVELSGTLAEPKARLAGSRVVELGKLILGLVDPRALLLFFTDLGSGEKNPCAAVLAQTGGEKK